VPPLGLLNPDPARPPARSQGVCADDTPWYGASGRVLRERKWGWFHGTLGSREGGVGAKEKPFLSELEMALLRARGRDGVPSGGEGVRNVGLNYCGLISQMGGETY